MPTAFTWSIAQLDTYPEKDGRADVVYGIHWVLVGNDSGATVMDSGMDTITLNPQANYIQFADLTEAVVLGWLHDAMGPTRMTRLYDEMSARAAQKARPTVVRRNPPWRGNNG